MFTPHWEVNPGTSDFPFLHATSQLIPLCAGSMQLFSTLNQNFMLSFCIVGLISEFLCSP